MSSIPVTLSGKGHPYSRGHTVEEGSPWTNNLYPLGNLGNHEELKQFQTTVKSDFMFPMPETPAVCLALEWACPLHWLAPCRVPNTASTRALPSPNPGGVIIAPSDPLESQAQ